MRAAALGVVFSVLAGGAVACAVDPASTSDFPVSLVLSQTDGSRVTRAWFDDAVTRYDHGILGDAVEAGTLVVDVPNSGACGVRLELDASHVFEDVAPRLADMDRDGTDEVIVVRTSVTLGAQIAVYGVEKDEIRLIAATPYIGQTHRWLAPVGIADLDGDGRIEIALVDRPHLAKVLQIWRWQDGGLVQVAAGARLTNHQIGETTIGGGIRDCGSGPEMVLADADWTRVIAVTFRNGILSGTDLGPYRDRRSLTAAMKCGG